MYSPHGNSSATQLGYQNNDKNTFIFNGTYSSLEQEIQQIEKSSFKNAMINVKGKLIKQRNNCCMWATIIFTFIFIFPVFFMCCDWWRKRVYPAHDVPEETYRSLSKLTNNPSMSGLNLTVTDNLFNERKAQILYQLLQNSQLKYFSLVNNAQNYDYNGHEYSHFDKYTGMFNNLPMKTDIRWLKLY